MTWCGKTAFPYITQHGNGGSPILFNDLVILSCDGYDQAFIVAADAETGTVRWKTDRAEPISQAYSTPVVIEVNGQDQLLSIGAFRTNSLNPETGEELWEVGYPEGFSNVPASPARLQLGARSRLYLHRLSATCATRRACRRVG